MNLPAELQAAIGEELAASGTSHRELADAAAALSRRYRGPDPGRGAGWPPAALGAYLATRLPATWAATWTALSAAALARPDWRPRTLLDIGGGPGTAMWAAALVWPGLEQVRVVERDARMVAVGRRLAQQAAHPAVREAAWILSDAGEALPGDPADLAVAAYVVGELGEAARARLVGRLWGLADLLVVVEPGTPEGAQAVLAARQAVLAAGGHTLAPCPHDAACPLSRPDWCHFAARVARTKLHRQLKGGQAPYEDEKFSYGAWAREPPQGAPSRILRHPRADPGRIQLTLCTPGGAADVVATRSGADFKAARKARWGGPWPPASR